MVIKNIDCKKYINGKIPPCSQLLGNLNPLIKDGKIIFRNLNRLFYFISINPKDLTISPNFNLNIQISLPTYIIGVFIDLIEKKKINYSKDIKIHDNEEINNFIHECINNPKDGSNNYYPSLTLIYTNNNAILAPFTYNINISFNNFIILFALNRIENNPGLFFINNSFVTEDAINFILSTIDITLEEK